MTNDEIDERDALAAELAGEKAAHQTTRTHYGRARDEMAKIIEALRTDLRAQAVTIKAQQAQMNELKAIAGELCNAMLAVSDTELALVKVSDNESAHDEQDAIALWQANADAHIAMLRVIERLEPFVNDDDDDDATF